MARYGAGSLYGAGVKYGAQDPAATRYNSGLEIFQGTYNQVKLSWNSINVDTSGDVASAPITHWKIIKTSSGYPDHPNDGIYVTGGAANSSSTGANAVSAGSFTDTETIFPEATEVTYSFWVYNAVDWYFCGAAEAIVVTDTHNTTLKLMSLLPGVWTSDNGYLTETGALPNQYNAELDSKGNLVETDLYKFMGGFGFYYDKLNLQAKNIYRSSDYRFYPRRQLATAIGDLGFNPEPTLGDQYHRSLFRYGNTINSLKGSSLGLNLYVKALTHFSNTVTLGANLFLDYLTSSFEGGIGTWAATGATVASALYNGSFPKPTLPLADTTSTYFKIKQNYYGSITTTATSAIVNSYSSTGTRTQTIPVTPGKSYLFSGYVRELNTTSTTLAAAIIWFDLTGAQINTTPVYGVAVNPSNTGWQLFESSQANADSFAPSNAAYAGISLSISGSSGTVFYIDDLHFYEALKSDITAGMLYPIYEDARTVNIQLDGTRTNYIPNPGFNDGTGGWDVLNGSLGIDSTNYVYGTTSAKFTASNTVGAIHSDWVTLEPDTYYTFSAYVKGPATKTAKVGIEFTFPQKAVDQIKVSKDAYSSYLPAPTNVTYSDTVTINATTFTRISVTVRSPEYVADNGLPVAKAIINFPSTTSGNSYYVDACLLEAAQGAKTYFEGTGGLAPTDPLTEDFVGSADCEWETRTTTNWLPNPSFESNSSANWTRNTSYTSAMSASTSQYKYGSYSLAVTASAANSYQVYTSAVFPSNVTTSTFTDYIKGGESITVSAYVYGPAATYTIGAGLTTSTSITSGLGVSGAGNTAIDSNGSFVVPANTWTRINATIQIPAGLSGTTLPVYLHIGSTLSSGTYYIDGAQMEFGTIPTPFVDPAAGSTVTFTNPKGSGAMWSSTRPLISGGRSYFWTRQDNKLERLQRSVENYLPLGASFKFTKGDPTPASLPEVDSTVFVENSFENNLNNWSSNLCYLNKVVGTGSIYTDTNSNTFYGAYSTSWLKAESVSGSQSTLSLSKSKIRVRTASGTDPNDTTQFYFSAAIKSLPVDTGTYVNRSTGAYSAIINWYKADGTTASAVTTSTTISGLTLTSNNAQRWNLLFGKAQAPWDAVFAMITISFAPTTVSTTAGVNGFLLDRVIFKKI